MSDITWIKVMTDMFGNRKIKQIEALPEKDSIIVIWFKLLILAGQTNDHGLIYFSENIPYTDEMLANEFDRPLNTIRLALATFQQYGMIENYDTCIAIKNWEKYQNTDGMDKVREQTRKRVSEYRKRQKLLIESKCNVTSNVTVTDGNGTDKEIEKEIDIDIEKETPPPPNNISYKYFGDHKRVQLTKEELRNLYETYEDLEVLRVITRLDNQIANKGSFYPNHYETLCKWILEDRQKAKGGAC